LNTVFDDVTSVPPIHSGIELFFCYFQIQWVRGSSLLYSWSWRLYREFPYKVFPFNKPDTAFYAVCSDMCRQLLSEPLSSLLSLRLLIQTEVQTFQGIQFHQFMQTTRKIISSQRTKSLPQRVPNIIG